VDAQIGGQHLGAIGRATSKLRSTVTLAPISASHSAPIIRPAGQPQRGQIELAVINLDEPGQVAPQRI
jgi:hypothetical protein